MTKPVYLFVSPHLDDVALSCGGYTSRLIAAGECVVIATMITADILPGAPLSWLARRNHLAWRLGDAPFAARRREDIAAAEMLGAQYAHLGLLDAAYRCDVDGKPLYTKNTVGVPVHPDDWKGFQSRARQKLQELFGRYVSDDVQIFCPLAVGGHVDHVIVRQSVETLCEPQNITYYEDYPYADQPNAVQKRLDFDRTGHWQPRLIALAPAEIEARIAVIGCYVSQVSGLFPSPRERIREIARARLSGIGGYLDWQPSPRASHERMVKSLRAYISRIGGERYWQQGTRARISPTADSRT